MSFAKTSLPSSVVNAINSGCTATIARLPYTRTLEGYKGDFLYRTTDFAMWSTVEVGLGITAGSIATLRPLLKQAFEITRSASAMPWSKPSLISGQQQSGKELSNLKPSIQKSITITTSRARRESAGSDEEIILGSSMLFESWQQQHNLPEYITFDSVDERGARSQSQKAHKHRSTAERKGSLGGANSSTIDSNESGKAAR
jgi:hypothetical protein